VVCIVTGTGLKDPGVPERYARAPMELPAELAAVEEVLKFPTSAILHHAQR